MADRTGDPAIIAFAQHQVTLTNWVFTTGGVLIVLVAGFGMVVHLGFETLQQSWLMWGLDLFVASGVVRAAILVPVQFLQARMSRRFTTGEDIPARYWLLNRIWVIFGILAPQLPLANLNWMVAKTTWLQRRCQRHNAGAVVTGATVSGSSVGYFNHSNFR